MWAMKYIYLRQIIKWTSNFRLFSESEVKDVCLSLCNNSNATSQNGNEDAVAVQNKPNKTHQNQRHSNQNHRYHRPPVVTDEEYSDSSGGLYNDYVTNANSVSVLRIAHVNNYYFFFITGSELLSFYSYQLHIILFSVRRHFANTKNIIIICSSCCFFFKNTLHGLNA